MFWDFYCLKIISDFLPKCKKYFSVIMKKTGLSETSVRSNVKSFFSINHKYFLPKKKKQFDKTGNSGSSLMNSTNHVQKE